MPHNTAGTSRALDSAPTARPQWNAADEQRQERIMTAVYAHAFISYCNTDEELARALARSAETHAALSPDELIEAYRMEQRIPKRYTVGAPK